MKLWKVATAATALILSTSTNAAPITFNLEYSGAAYGNTAVGNGFITVDDDYWPTNGLLLEHLKGVTGEVINSPIVLDLSLTISGASLGNGSFGYADFSSVAWDTHGTLDFSQELVGQATDDLPWGTADPYASTFAGDFNLFGDEYSNPASPFALSPFVLIAGGGGGSDYLALVSMQVSTVPVPAAVWLFGSGLIGLAGFARRKKV